jgi:hypothetical protein
MKSCAMIFDHSAPSRRRGRPSRRQRPGEKNTWMPRRQYIRVGGLDSQTV